MTQQARGDSQNITELFANERASSGRHEGQRPP